MSWASTCVFGSAISRSGGPGTPCSANTEPTTRSSCRPGIRSEMSEAPGSDVVPILLRVPRAEVAYVKFVFESYEGVAVCRTLDRHEALLVVLAVPDFLA